MLEKTKIITNLIACYGGELKGRTRLQKIAYLMDRCGGKFGCTFTYHYYGPYCFELAGAIDDAEMEGHINIEERPGGHGVPYAVFTLKNDTAKPDRLGSLQVNRARKLLQKTKPFSNTVIELAATVVFLRDDWDYFDKENVDAVSETIRRKPVKCDNGRMKAAIDLVRELGLDPESALCSKVADSTH